MDTPETKAAFINAQTAMMLCEIEEMKAQLIKHEHSPAWDKKRWWEELREKWEPVLGYNALIEFFRG